MKNRLAPSGSFTSHVLTLMTGTAIAQLISFAGSPILTRQYLPDEFGVFALFAGIGTLISVISTGRYEYAIVLPENDNDAINLLILSFLLVVLTSIACWLSIEAYLILSKRSYDAGIYLLPVFVLSTGLYQALNLWNNRLKRFHVLSFSRIILSSSTVLVSIGFGYFGSKINGLFLGAIVGQVVAVLALGWWTFHDVRILSKNINSVAIRRLAKEYANFPKINVAHALFDNLNSTGTIFVVTYFFGASILGYYSFMMRILQAPTGMIGASVSQVFYQRIAETYAAGGNVAHLVKVLIKRLSIIALLPALIILLVGPSLFGLLFGEQWVIAGKYAQALIPFMYLYFVLAPLPLIPFIFSKQKEAFFMSACGNMLFILSIAISAIIFNSMIIGLILYSFLFVIYFFVYVNWIFKIIKR
jgi:O-antigen/teichoic acid export membrane protein